uniref:Uncharacterized protein n=1 Tax=Rhizophora mucronata TaxID=61149 RepID=A0A2P2IHC5_RHIMU
MTRFHLFTSYLNLVNNQVNLLVLLQADKDFRKVIVFVTNG